jgi:gas vesicle protein
MKSGKVVLGVLAGLAAGAALGILFAPDKGKSTRKRIRNKGHEYSAAVRDKSNEYAEAISQKFQDVKDQGLRFADNFKHKEKNIETDLKNKV